MLYYIIILIIQPSLFQIMSRNQAFNNQRGRSRYFCCYLVNLIKFLCKEEMTHSDKWIQLCKVSVLLVEIISFKMIFLKVVLWIDFKVLLIAWWTFLTVKNILDLVHKNVHKNGREGSYVCQTFVSSSTMGSDGKINKESYYENSSGQHKGNQTISQKQQAYKNNNGVNRIA